MKCGAGQTEGKIRAQCSRQDWKEEPLTPEDRGGRCAWNEFWSSPALIEQLILSSSWTMSPASGDASTPDDFQFLALARVRQQSFFMSTKPVIQATKRESESLRACRQLAFHIAPWTLRSCQHPQHQTGYGFTGLQQPSSWPGESTTNA